MRVRDDHRGRGTPEMIAAQWQAKAAWHRRRANLPIAEKIRLLLEMQQAVFPILRQRGRLREWERPWEIEP